MAEYNLSRPRTSTRIISEAMADWFLIAIPLFFVLVTVIAMLLTNQSSGSANLNFDRVKFEPGRIAVSVLNTGRGELTIAQAIVNDAVWEFTSQPSATLQRMERATIALRYPWMEGEAHEIKFITSDGSIYAHAIPSATETPQPSLEQFANLGLIALIAGLIPIVLGILGSPTATKIRKRAQNLFFGFALGLLVFAGVDAFSSVLQTAGRVAKPFHGAGLIAIGAAVGFLVVTVLARGMRERNVKVLLQYFLFFVLLAGGPILMGIFFETFVNSDLWTTLTLALGVGATVRVVCEIAMRPARDASAGIWESTSVFGMLLGLAVMYLGGLLM